MPKVLKCSDVVPGCAAVLEGVDDAEVMRKVTEHAKTAHKMAILPPDVATRVKAAIKSR